MGRLWLTFMYSKTEVRLLRGCSCHFTSWFCISSILCVRSGAPVIQFLWKFDFNQMRETPQWAPSHFSDTEAEKIKNRNRPHMKPNRIGSRRPDENGTRWMPRENSFSAGEDRVSHFRKAKLHNPRNGLPFGVKKMDEPGFAAHDSHLYQNPRLDFIFCRKMNRSREKLRPGVGWVYHENWNYSMYNFWNVKY